MKLVKVNHPGYHVNGVDRLFNDFFNQGVNHDRYNRKELSSQPATNLFENDDAVEIEMSIPGFEKEQVKISVEKDLLIVKGEAEGSAEESKENIRMEFKLQNFEKRFRLSEKMDLEQISASFKNGILKLTVSKKEEAVPQKREIEIA